MRRLCKTRLEPYLQLKKAASNFMSETAFLFVEVRGVEPLTSCMPCKRSSQLSYTPERADAKINFSTLLHKLNRKINLPGAT